MADAFRTIVIPVAHQINARNLAKVFARVGLDMFPTLLSASGSNPATHAISSGYVPTEFTDLLPLKEWTYDGSQWQSVVVSAGDAAAARAVAVAAGFNVTLVQVNAIFAAIDVSAQPPFDAMARLGLKIINPPVLA